MTATVLAIYRYPLKSAGGERLSTAEVDAGGLVGDRRWAVQQQGRVVRAKDHPALATWTTRLVGDLLEVDDGSGFTAAEQAVGRHLPGATLTRAEDGHRMVAAVHLASVDAAQAADAPTGCDPNPRVNILVGELAPGAERGWVGQDVRIGEVVLRVTELPRHCLGVYAQVVRGGVLREGGPVLTGSKP